MSISKSKSNRMINYIQQKDEFDYLIDLIESLEVGNSIGILLNGPPGTGKTLLAISLANYFNASYYMIDGSPDLDRRDIEGNWELIQGDTHFNYGPLTRAIFDANENGIAFIIINEVNAIRESEQISLNSLLTENHINLISKGFERFSLDTKSKLIIIGTMNKGVVGVNRLQEAFEDRFIVSPEINYPKREKEIEIAAKISGCDERIADIVVDSARQIRKQALQDFSISKVFSTRHVVDFCLVVSRMPSKYLKHNIENVIINKLGENQEEKKSIAMILDGKMFETKLRNILSPNYEKKANLSEKSDEQQPEKPAIQIMRNCVQNYINQYGIGSVLRKNGKVKWKLFDWLWFNNREELQEYVKLTVEFGYHEEYTKTTGKYHLYKNKVSLAYIRWLYREKNDEFEKFLMDTHKIL